MQENIINEEYYKALGIYTHHLNEVLEKGNEFRTLAIEIKHIVDRVVSSNYPYSEHNLPPTIDDNKLQNLTNKLINLNQEIDKHIKEANLYAKEAKKNELQRKDY